MIIHGPQYLGDSLGSLIAEPIRAVTQCSSTSNDLGLHLLLTKCLSLSILGRICLYSICNTSLIFYKYYEALELILLNIDKLAEPHNLA